LQPGDPCVRAAFRSTLAKYLKRLKRKAPEVIQDLDSIRRRELAALVADWDSDEWELWTKREKVIKEAKAGMKSFQARRPAIEKRKQKALAELANFRGYVKKLGAYLIYGDLLKAITQIEREFQKIEIPSPQAVKDKFERLRDAYHPAKENPLLPSNHALFEFFHKRCGLKKFDAEIRTDKIGIAFWGWSSDFQEGAGNVKGSSAVRMRLKRFNPK
jgi:hypothetical protein